MSAHRRRGARGTAGAVALATPGTRLRAAGGPLCVRAPASVTPAPGSEPGGRRSLAKAKGGDACEVGRSSGVRASRPGWGRHPPTNSGLAGLHQPLPRRMGGCAAPQPPLLGPRPLPTAAAPNKGPAGREGGAVSPATASGLLEAPLWAGLPRGRGQGVGAGAGLLGLDPQAAHSPPRVSFFWFAGMGVGGVLILLPSPSPGLGVVDRLAPWCLLSSLAQPASPTLPSTQHSPDPSVLLRAGGASAAHILGSGSPPWWVDAQEEGCCCPEPASPGPVQGPAGSRGSCRGLRPALCAHECSCVPCSGRSCCACGLCRWRAVSERAGTLPPIPARLGPGLGHFE